MTDELLIETLHTVSYEKLCKFLKQVYNLDINKYIVKISRPRVFNTIQFCLYRSVFKEIDKTRLDFLMKKYGWSIASDVADSNIDDDKGGGYIWIRPTESNYPNEESFDWKEVAKEIKSKPLYHISTKKLEKGKDYIKPKASRSETAFEQYTERIYLISEYLCENYGIGYDCDTNTVLRAMAKKLCEYHHSDRIFIYEVKIPENYTVYADTAFPCGIYVKNSIKDFELIEQIEPAD